VIDEYTHNIQKDCSFRNRNLVEGMPFDLKKLVNKNDGSTSNSRKMTATSSSSQSKSTKSLITAKDPKGILKTDLI